MRTRPTFRHGLAFALLALIVQLAVGGYVPSSVDLFAAQRVPICAAGSNTGSPTPSAPRHHLPDLLPCPLLTAMLSSAIALPTLPALAAPDVHALHRPEMPPPATGPPAIYRLAAHPRGPPAFLT